MTQGEITSGWAMVVAASDEDWAKQVETWTQSAKARAQKKRNMPLKQRNYEQRKKASKQKAEQMLAILQENGKAKDFQICPGNAHAKNVGNNKPVKQECFVYESQAKNGKGKFSSKINIVCKICYKVTQEKNAATKKRKSQEKTHKS